MTVSVPDHLLSLVGPECGPCAFCGHPDKRHRIADAIAERVMAGEDPPDVAADYGISPSAAHVLAVGAGWVDQDAPALPPNVAQGAPSGAPGGTGRAGPQAGPHGRLVHTDYDYALIEVIKVVDGDTVDLRVSAMVDIGFHVEVEAVTAHRFRLLGVDTPERGQPGWAEATEFVRQWFGSWYPDAIRVRTRKGDSFGRWLADVCVVTTGETLSQALLEAGLAKVWPA